MEKATRMTEPMGMMEAMAVEILTEVTSTVEKVVLMSEGCLLPTRGGEEVLLEELVVRVAIRCQRRPDLARRSSSGSSCFASTWLLRCRFIASSRSQRRWRKEMRAWCSCKCFRLRRSPCL